MRRVVWTFLLGSAFSACLAVVPEAQCFRNADCADAGVCIDAQCTYAGGTGGTGGGAPGGSGGGGGGIGGGLGGGLPFTGGGIGGGSPGGGAGGGGGACGCLDRGGRCRDGTSALQCGSGGNRCMACSLGEQCVNGACVMGSCGPQSCGGCCTNNVCLDGNLQNRFACGAGGQACSACSQGQSCFMGLCVARDGGMPPPPPFLDAGIVPNVDGGVRGLATGDACSRSAECQPPMGAFCMTESVSGQPTGYVDGYCSSECSLSGGACSSGSVCVSESFFGSSQSLCRSTCPQVGEQSTCRSGYVCAPSPVSNALGYCRPRCDNGGFLADCAAGTSCDSMSGLCQ